jgi:hypothetical protein
VVEIVEGQLTINITGNTKTLMPTTTQSRRLTTSINVVSFLIAGQPDTHVRFFMSGENLMGLYYEERQKNEDSVIGIAAPKISRPSSYVLRSFRPGIRAQDLGFSGAMKSWSLVPWWQTMQDCWPRSSRSETSA